MSEEMSTAAGGEVVVPAAGWSPARLAYLFYGVAAAGAVVGQVWVAMTHIPWPDGVPVGLRLAAVLPFALCLELLAMVLAAMGDERQRAGERAYGFRGFSAAVAVLAVSVIVAGHWGDPYTVAAFGGLSVSAYALWLLHSSARRRDALRAAGQLATVAPAYGLWRRLRHPVVTARAAELAREHGYGMYASLRAAELALRAERRRPAIADAVEAAVRAEHPDRRMAQIAVSTLDLDRIAEALASRADYDGWAERLAPAVTAPTVRSDSPDGPPSPDESPLFVPDEWVSHPGPAESADPGEPPAAGGQSPTPQGKPPAKRRVSRPRRTKPTQADAPEVTDSLVAQARAASDDSDTRMAWLWHATGGRASGRQLAAAGEVSAATGIRRAAQWRRTPPPDPRGDSPVPVA